MQEIAPDKAPGPDGFIGVFYKISWDVIKEDILAAVNFFYNMHDQHFNLLNNAHIVLLPKKRKMPLPWEITGRLVWRTASPN